MRPQCALLPSTPTIFFHDLNLSLQRPIVLSGSLIQSDFWQCLQLLQYTRDVSTVFAVQVEILALEDMCKPYFLGTHTHTTHTR